MAEQRNWAFSMPRHAEAERIIVQICGGSAPPGTRFAALGHADWLALEGIAMRTFERGVEGETLSCGTGVTAAALVAAHRHGLTSPIDVQAPGGNLQVRFVAEPEGFTQIVLLGAVAEVFTGIVSRS